MTVGRPCLSHVLDLGYVLRAELVDHVLQRRVRADRPAQSLVHAGPEHRERHQQRLQLRVVGEHATSSLSDPGRVVDIFVGYFCFQVIF